MRAVFETLIILQTDYHMDRCRAAVRATLQNVHNPACLSGGKTIVGALMGGWITVEVMKRYIGFRTSTGDLYAIPLAIGIAPRRMGCFLTGLSDNT